MPPELLYEICKYLSIHDYIILKKVKSKHLYYLIETFRGPLEARFIYSNGKPINSLMRGVEHIARTNPCHKWNAKTTIERT